MLPTNEKSADKDDAINYYNDNVRQPLIRKKSIYKFI
jgi:hypothetical protein